MHDIYTISLGLERWQWLAIALPFAVAYTVATVVVLVAGFNAARSFFKGRVPEAE